MDFPFGETVYRDRAPQVPDQYNPSRTKPGSHDDPAAQTIVIPNAFIGSSSSLPVADATRSQVLSQKSLYCGDPDVDVKVGDRIRTAGGDVYYVRVVPAADRNPFTGWQPVKEIPLEHTLG